MTCSKQCLYGIGLPEFNTRVSRAAESKSSHCFNLFFIRTTGGGGKKGEPKTERDGIRRAGVEDLKDIEGSWQFLFADKYEKTAIVLLFRLLGETFLVAARGVESVRERAERNRRFLSQKKSNHAP